MSHVDDTFFIFICIKSSTSAVPLHLEQLPPALRQLECTCVRRVTKQQWRNGRRNGRVGVRSIVNSDNHIHTHMLTLLYSNFILFCSLFFASCICSVVCCMPLDVLCIIIHMWIPVNFVRILVFDRFRVAAVITVDAITNRAH